MKHIKRWIGKKPSEDVQTLGESSSSNVMHSLEAPASKTEVAVNVLDVTIQLIQQVADLVPIDLAKSVLKGISSILLLIQKCIKNKLDLMGLAQICKDICSTLARAMNGVSVEQLSDVVKDALDALRSSINQLHSKVEEALQHGHVRRVAGATLDQKTINDWTGELDQIQRSFNMKVNIVSAIRLDQIYHVLQHHEIKTLIPEPPPAPPAFFFGRERLFAEVKSALLSNEDVALIGPGGIGKSSLAKELINDEDIQKCYRRRFFVSYDRMDPVTITPSSFIDRIAGVLGLPALGVEGYSQVISNLTLSPVLIVLDNAETFEDTANPDSAEDIASIVANIANTRGVTVILTSRTSRSARDACWTDLNVPPLETLPARQYFRKIYHGDISDDDVDELLAAVECHPLSIHILAYAARESRWTGKELMDKWKVEQSRLLQRGRKKENLGFTIRLSLNSPSIQDLGDDVTNVLSIIAFFPQGVNLNHASCLFPSIPNIMLLLDMVSNVSLAYRSGAFVTALAPIRLFLLDEFPTAGLELLVDIRRIYYDFLCAVSDTRDSHGDLITSDHLNIEHLLKYDIAKDPENNQYTLRACRCFLDVLRCHKLRPTSLAPIISSLPEGSQPEKGLKARCLFALGRLYFKLSNYGSAATAHSSTSVLFVAIGNHGMASLSTSNAAVANNNQAYYSRARQLLEDFIHSPSWQCINERQKAEIRYTLDFAKMHMSRDGADELFLHSMDHWCRGLSSHIRHWQARMYHGYSTPEDVERKLEPLRPQCVSSFEAWDRWEFYETMAAAAFLQRRFDVAIALLKQARDAVDGNFSLMLIVLCYQAAVTSVQGNYGLSRSLLQHTLETLTVVATPSSADFLLMRYVHGRNELYAKNYSEAHRLLLDVVADADVQGAIEAKMFSWRALGEVETLLGCETESDRYFAQTEELCREAGIPSELLGVVDPMVKLDDDRFTGWKMFLQARTSQ